MALTLNSFQYVYIFPVTYTATWIYENKAVKAHTLYQFAMYMYNVHAHKQNPDMNINICTYILKHLQNLLFQK